MTAKWHWRLGKLNGFPWCCIFMFILRIPFYAPAKRHGVRYTHSGDSFFVPCCVFHRQHRSLEDHWTASDIEWR